MISELHVRDLALIEDVWLEFGPGMSVLTGETGAGKTALLGALKLLLGERADSSTVRAQAAEMVVSAAFQSQGTEIVVRRKVTRDGRSRCAIDGDLASVGELGARVGPLVDLHGQHEHQALLSPSTHVGYLDRWVGEQAESALADYQALRRDWQRAADEVRMHEERIARATAEADYLEWVVREIEQVDPQPGEDDRLRSRLPALQNAGRLDEAASQAATLIRGDAGASERLSSALRELSRQQGIDPALDELAERIEAVLPVVDDIGSSLRAYRDTIEHDPTALEQTLSRLAALSGLMKKHGPGLDDVIGKLEGSRSILGAAASGEESLAESQRALKAARDAFEHSAARLQSLREGAVPGFVRALKEATADLAMDGARFDVAFEPLEFESWTDKGPSRVAFLYSPAPSQPTRPLAKIASGGELSRVMLALKSVLGSADRVETLVFDEVDAGIGGATATAVGSRLKALARTHQVIVVTHLAQVAAFADTHLVVTKSIEGDTVATTVRSVDGQERVAEIARMLGGTESDAGFVHARELLDRSTEPA